MSGVADLPKPLQDLCCARLYIGLYKAAIQHSQTEDPELMRTLILAERISAKVEERLSAKIEERYATLLRDEPELLLTVPHPDG